MSGSAVTSLMDNNEFLGELELLDGPVAQAAQTRVEPRRSARPMPAVPAVDDLDRQYAPADRKHEPPAPPSAVEGRLPAGNMPVLFKVLVLPMCVVAGGALAAALLNGRVSELLARWVR